MSPALRSAWFGATLTAMVAAGLLVGGCSGGKEASRQAGEGMEQAAKDAAGDATRTALRPAVSPVLDLLTRGKEQLETGDVAAALTTMGGFDAVWGKAAPVIQPLAGERWPAIDSAARQVAALFEDGRSPAAGSGAAAIGDLITPLRALIGS
jgi:hypothetical protein